MGTYETLYRLKQRVLIDGGEDMPAVIVRIILRADARPLYDCEWVNDGAMQCATIEEFRLSAAS
jgi:hypothetical protein